MQIRYASLFARKEICEWKKSFVGEILPSAGNLDLCFSPQPHLHPPVPVAIHPSLISPTPAPFKTMPEAKAYVSSHMDRDRMLIMFPFPELTWYARSSLSESLGKGIDERDDQLQTAGFE